MLGFVLGHPTILKTKRLNQYTPIHAKVKVMRQIIGYIIVGSGIIFIITILYTFISSIYGYLKNPLVVYPGKKCISLIFGLIITTLAALLAGWIFMKLIM